MPPVRDGRPCWAGCHCTGPCCVTDGVWLIGYPSFTGDAPSNGLGFAVLNAAVAAGVAVVAAVDDPAAGVDWAPLLRLRLRLEERLGDELGRLLVGQRLTWACAVKVEAAAAAAAAVGPLWLSAYVLSCGRKNCR